MFRRYYSADDTPGLAPPSGSPAADLLKSSGEGPTLNDTRQWLREEHAKESERFPALKPSKCRMVLFTDPEQPHVTFSAVVTAVTEEGQVHVCAFDPVFGPRNFVTTGEGNAPGNWSWPPRA